MCCFEERLSCDKFMLLSGHRPVLLLLYIWSETELSIKHWVVWDICRRLNNRKTCLEIPRSLYWPQTVSTYNIHNLYQTLANRSVILQPSVPCGSSQASISWHLDSRTRFTVLKTFDFLSHGVLQTLLNTIHLDNRNVHHIAQLSLN